MELSKGSYLCAENYDEPAFEFCNGVPKEGEDWYEVCGTPYDNYNEYLLVISLICALGITLYGSLIRSPRVLMGKPKDVHNTNTPKSKKERKKN
eukprot:TRINITY_DN7354_c0_g1_i1.p2 TRINITY_DN7354_c0_g1~~TRINITY_DN7354_c0_g1_i1.p2  ORF type:complete len:94 (-),score=16.19 TRINITY_DN7354_c0_g1_i1:119-400(-)